MLCCFFNKKNKLLFECVNVLIRECVNLLVKVSGIYTFSRSDISTVYTCLFRLSKKGSNTWSNPCWVSIN